MKVSQNSSVLKEYHDLKIFLNIEGRPIDTDLRKKAVSLQKALDWEDAGPEKAALFGASETGKNIIRN